eukprot:2646873-Prymnesium_polylepis.2
MVQPVADAAHVAVEGDGVTSPLSATRGSSVSYHPDCVKTKVVLNWVPLDGLASATPPTGGMLARTSTCARPVEPPSATLNCSVYFDPPVTEFGRITTLRYPALDDEMAVSLRSSAPLVTTH